MSFWRNIKNTASKLIGAAANSGTKGAGASMGNDYIGSAKSGESGERTYHNTPSSSNSSSGYQSARNRGATTNSTGTGRSRVFDDTPDTETVILRGTSKLSVQSRISSMVEAAHSGVELNPKVREACEIVCLAF